MKKAIKIAVIGGSGKAGQSLVKELLNQEFNLKVLLRRPELDSLSHPSVEIVSGDMGDYTTALNLISGCDAVISTLGQRPGEPLISCLATTHIIKAMQVVSCRRYIVVAGLSLDLPGDHKSAAVREATDFMQRTYPLVTADKQKMYPLLSESDIDWTLVRLPFIVQTEERSQLAIDLEDCPGDHINTVDLADFLIQQISDREYIRMAPFIASV